MAKIADSAIGAILEIPSTALEKIRKAQRAIEDLQITSKRASEAVSAHWGTTAVDGLTKFINALNNAQTAISGFKTNDININIKPAEQQLRDVSTTAQKTAEDVSNAVIRLAQSNINFENFIELDRTVKKLGLTYKSLAKDLKDFKTAQEHRVIDDPEALSINKKIEALREYLRVKKLSETRQQYTTTTVDRDILTEQKRLLQDQINLRKQINEQKLKVGSGEITDSKTLEKDKADLKALFNQYRENGKAIKDLAQEKKNLSEAGSRQFELNAEKQTNQLLEQQRKYRQDLNKELNKTRELTSATQVSKATISSRDESQIQRQLNNDYSAMIRIIREVGKVKADAAKEGRATNQQEDALIQVLWERYRGFAKEVLSIQNSYAALGRARAEAFRNDRSEQLARNAVMLAEAQAKATLAAERQAKALHDISPAIQAYNQINSQIERETSLLQQVKDKAAQATQEFQNWKNLNPTFDFSKAQARLDELKTKIDEIKAKAASQGPTKASITMAAAKPLQAEYDALSKTMSQFLILKDRETTALDNVGLAVQRYMPRLEALRGESNRLSQEIERLVSANAKFNSELSKGNNVKSLSTEYKNLVTTIQRLGEQMNAFRTAGGDTNSASYRAMMSELQKLVAREKEIRMMSINEVEAYRLERAKAAYQADLSAFVQNEAQKKAVAQQALDERIAKAKIAGQQYMQSYAGAMTQADKFLSGQSTGMFAVNLENVKRVLADLKAASGNLNLLNPADVQKAEQLKRKIAELETLLKKYKAAATPDKPVISPQDAINAAKNARTLKELQDAYKNLKTVMSTIDPNSTAWRQMNQLLGQTKDKIDKIRASMGELNNQSLRTSGIMSQLQNRMAMVFSVAAIKGYMQELIKVRAQFELQNVALRAIIQNKEEADRIFSQVQQMALQSPFTIMQLTTYTKQLAAYRVEASKLVGTTKMLADVSAGLGVDMQRLILAYGQVKSANYLRATEIRQFTEAGLNIAGELASYFSELRGKMISVGDVMDMVTKRMVKFEDVEEVFRRVTSEGGLFYDMQKKQSESLYGQLQRITDAYNIMLNEIGKSNQGIISGVLQSIRWAINNWRIFVNILSGAGIAMATYAAKTMIAAAANGTLALSQNAVNKAMIATMATMKKMFAFLTANPYVLFIAGTAAATYAILDWRSKVESVRASYDRMLVGMQNQSDKLNNIASRITDNNNRLKSTAEAVKSVEKGTSEYNDALADNKDALSEQFRLLNELRAKFPEVYDGIVKMKDGTIDLTDALNKYQEVARAFSVVTTLTERDVHWYDEDYKTDMEDASKAWEQQNADLATANAQFNALFAIAEGQYNTKKAENKLTQQDIANHEALLKIKKAGLDTVEKMNAAFDVTWKIWGGLNKDADAFQNAVKAAWIFAPVYQRNIKEAEDEIWDLAKRTMTAFGVTTAKEFRKLPDETKEVAQMMAQQMVRESGLALDDIQRDILRRKWEIPLGIKVIADTKETDPGYLRNLINKYVKEHPETEMAPIGATEDIDNYFKSLSQSRETSLKEETQYRKAIAKLDQDQTNEEVANHKKAVAASQKAMMDYFGIVEKQKSKGGRQSDLELKRWRDLEKLIVDVSTAYEKARKSFSVEESNQQIEKLFGAPFRELGVDIKDFYKDGKYGADELIDALRVLLSMTNAVTEERKKFRSETQRKISDTQVEIEVKLREDSENKIKKDIDELFANYELTKELGNLGLNIDLTYLVGGKPKSLKDIRADLNAAFEAEGGKNGPKEIVKMYEDAFKKLADIEHKNQIEQIKNYNKYLLESMSERIRIEVQAQREIAALRRDETIDDTTRQMAILRRQQQMRADLSKQEWKDFQGSDMYISMFENIEHASTQSLEAMLAKLRGLRESLKGLPADQLRAIVKQIENVETQIYARNPFKALSDNIGLAIKSYKELKDAEERYREAQDRLDFEKKNRDAYALATGQIEEQLKIARAKNGVDEEGNQIEDALTMQLEEQLRLRRENLATMNANVTSLETESTTLGNLVTKLKQGRKAAGEALQTVGSWAGTIANGIGDIASSLENVFGEMSPATADFVSSMQEILGGVGEMASGVGRFMAGDYIGGAVQALGGLAKTIGGIFNIGDKKKEREIVRLKEKVYDLDRAYQKLEKSIDAAFTFDQYNAGYDKMQANLKQQEKSYEEMIRLEEAKKKTDKDKVKEYTEALDAVREKQEELHKQRIEAMGSTTDYASEAENFVNAWLNAYREVGDGTEALKETWDEFIDNLFVKQAAYQLVSTRIQKYIKALNDAIDENKTDFDLKQIVNETRERFSKEAGDISRILEELFDAYGMSGAKGDFILSDLQKGIQNITEPQAAAIEAYLNSMRFAVFRHTEQLDMLIASVQAQYGAGSENPVVTELKGIRGVLDRIDNRLSSVIVNEIGRGSVVRVA